MCFQPTGAANTCSSVLLNITSRRASAAVTITAAQYQQCVLYPFDTDADVAADPQRDGETNEGFCE